MVLCGLAVVLCALAVRLVHIERSRGPVLRAEALEQQQGRSILPARRGLILDAQGRVAAASHLLDDVFVDPALVDDVDALAAALGVRINRDPSLVAETVRRRADHRFVVVAEAVGELEAEAVRSFGHRAVGLVQRAVRTYPLGHSMAHVLGFVGRDGRGLEGVELRFDRHLAGHEGHRRTVRDARRRAVWPDDSGDDPFPRDGGHVLLTIDAEIQRIVEEVLQHTVERCEAESGVGIVMRPRTADILAMACCPAFDPLNASEAPAEVRRNRTVTDPVEPGSTFKPFIASGALAGGFVQIGERFDCGKGYRAFGRREIRDSHAAGVQDLAGIVIHSSNIGMAQVGQRMGVAGLHPTLQAFGFGERTGVECPGEDAGILYPPERWTSYSVTSIPMGYEIGVTPLQLATAFGAILNDGVLLRPRIVRALLGPDGSVVERFEGPQEVRRVIPSNVARYLAREVLPRVVREGTGAPARLASHAVLGKTGTTKLAYRDRRGYEEGAYLSSFLGAAPVHDPEVVVLVMIRRPNAARGYYGSQVSAPAVREILAGVLTYLQVPPDAEVLAMDGM
jgi:cell division protein FtsI/penicillin-binding protein 2